MRPTYRGSLERKHMDLPERTAMESYYSQKARSKKTGLPAPAYSTREFIWWWMNSLRSFKGTIPTCGRIDHSKGYSWDNIEMQDMADNSREGVLRNKSNIKQSIENGQAVKVLCKKTGDCVAVISSIRETAKLFGVSQRLVQFYVRGVYKNSRKINFHLVGGA